MCPGRAGRIILLNKRSCEASHLGNVLSIVSKKVEEFMKRVLGSHIEWGLKIPSAYNIIEEENIMEIIYSNYIAEDYVSSNLSTDWVDNISFIHSQTTLSKTNGKKTILLSTNTTDYRNQIDEDPSHIIDGQHIYVDLANAKNQNDIIEFCKKYGSLANPKIFSRSIIYNHSLSVLEKTIDDIDEILKKNNCSNSKDSNKFYDVILLDHFYYYQYEIKNLLDISYNLQLYKKEKNPVQAIILKSLFESVINLLTNPYYNNTLPLEYDHVMDDELVKLCRPYPLAWLRIYMAQFILKNFNSSAPSLAEQLKTLFYHSAPDGKTPQDSSDSICIDENSPDNITPLLETLSYFLSIYYQNGPHTGEEKDFPLSFYKNNHKKIISFIEQAFSDFLLYHLREVPFAQHTLNSNKIEVNFPTLATAIFFYFYCDQTNTEYIRCGNPNCNKIFARNKTKRNKMYCCQRCASAMSSAKARRRKKEQQEIKEKEDTI